MEKPFDVSIDRERRIITIQGIRYDFGVFDDIGFAREGRRFEVGKRRDGVVELKSLAAT